MKKRLILSILAVSLLLGLALPVMASETTEATEETTEATEESKREFSTAKEGECGDDIRWKLEGHTLTITGKGEMDAGCPWEFYKDTIETVIFNGEITTIGDGAFDSCNNLETVLFPETLVEIGEKAFFSCNALETLLLPDTFRKFGPECLRDCENLENVYCEGPMPSFKGNCMYNDHTVVVHYSQQTPWPQSEIERLMSNFGGRVYVQMGSADGWADVRKELATLRSETPVAETVVAEETVAETVPETVAATEPAAPVPVMTQPVVVETLPVQVVETTEAAEPVVQETQPLELVFVEPEMDLDTGETEPKTLKENIADKVTGFNWGWVIAGFGGLVVLLILALVIRSVSHKGGKYSD